MSVLTPLEGLIRARALVAAPYAWFKGSWYRKQPRALFGVCYCALGAVRNVYDIDSDDGYSNEKYDAYLAAEDVLNQHLPAGSWSEVVGFNDAKTTKKKDVLALFDNAIASLQKETA